MKNTWNAAKMNAKGMAKVPIFQRKRHTIKDLKSVYSKIIINRISPWHIKVPDTEETPLSKRGLLHLHSFRNVFVHVCPNFRTPWMTIYSRICSHWSAAHTDRNTCQTPRPHSSDIQKNCINGLLITHNQTTHIKVFPIIQTHNRNL